MSVVKTGLEGMPPELTLIACLEFPHRTAASIQEMREKIAALESQLSRMEKLIRDAVEDETEFETEWNHEARKVLGIPSAPTGGKQ